MKITIGELIKMERLAAGLTQTQLAERMNIPFQSISQWERGKRQPKKESLQRIAIALGLESDYFFSVNEQIEEFKKTTMQEEATIHILTSIYGDSLEVYVRNSDDEVKASSNHYFRIGKKGTTMFVLHTEQFNSLVNALEESVKALISVMDIDKRPEPEIQQALFDEMRSPDTIRRILHAEIDHHIKEGESIPFTYEDVDSDPVGLYEKVHGKLSSQPVIETHREVDYRNTPFDLDRNWRIEGFPESSDDDSTADTSEPRADHEEPTEQKGIDWGPPAGEEIW